MQNSPVRRTTCAIALISLLGSTACSTGGFSVPGLPQAVGAESTGPFAPGVNQRKGLEDGIEVGHRLMAAGQFELAIKAFNRTALARGLDGEVLSGLGSANLGLGRLGQAEKLLRRAVKEDPKQPEIWNNLGVVLMERGKTVEAEQVFRKAFALDNGQSDAIRDNLRVALSKSQKSDTDTVDNDNYKLVRRGSGDFLIRPAS